MALIDELNQEEKVLLEKNRQAFSENVKKKIKAGKGKMACEHPDCVTKELLAVNRINIVITPQLLFYAVCSACAHIESLNSKSKIVKPAK